MENTIFRSSLTEASELPKVQFNCTQCSYEFGWKFQVDHHFRTSHANVVAKQLFHAHTEPEPFSCTCSNFASFYKLDLYEHWKQSHEGCINMNIEQRSLRVKFDDRACACKYKSDSMLCLVQHAGSCGSIPNPKRKFNSMKQIDWHRCTKCSYKSKLKRNVDRHETSVHAFDDKRAVCSYKTKLAESLRKRMLTHVPGSDWYTCSICNVRYQHKNRLKWHMTTHAKLTEPISWFCCSECSYKAKTGWELNRHKVQLHAPPENATMFACSRCPFTARYKKGLKAHLFRHAARDKWLQCDKCDHKAEHAFGLKQHMSKHVAEDFAWFTCTRCDTYRTTRKRNLTRHMMTHAFSDEIDLFTSDLTRTRAEKIEWFNCPYCPHVTKRRSNLKKHVLTHARAVLHVDRDKDIQVEV